MGRSSAPRARLRVNGLSATAGGLAGGGGSGGAEGQKGLFGGGYQVYLGAEGERRVGALPAPERRAGRSLDVEHGRVSEEFARAVIAELREEGMVERANLQSFDWRVLLEARALAPELRAVCLTIEQRWHDNILRGRPGPSPWTAGLDIDAFGGSVPQLVEAAGCAVWSPFYRDLTEETVAEAHALGLRVVVWTVNEVDDMLALARLGANGIITDYPDRAVEALAPWRPAR